jgi:uncharacterized GH25 family protein
MRASLFVVLALGLAGSAVAHDVWIQPASFAVAAGTPVPVTVLVGHGTFRQRWGVTNDRVLRFQDVSSAGTVDRRTVIHPDSGTSDAVLSFAGAGTHMLVLESSHAISVLPSIRFNDYIKVEGLVPAIETRARLGLNDKDGRETYSRRAKALVQVGVQAGTATGDQSFVTRPVGLSLEIVPQKSPYALATGEALPVQILYEGKPLAGATVKLNNLDFDTRPFATKLSDAAGRTSFDVPRRGKWQLNVIWTKPVTGNPAADFDTTFSSLSFGYVPMAPR